MPQSKVALRTHLSANFRALKITLGEFPGALIWSLLSSISATLPSIAALWLSARLIDELTHGRNVRQIAINAGLAVIITFVLAAIGSVATRKLDVETGFSFMMNKLYALRGERFVTLDFEHVEDSSTRDLITSIEGSEQWSGYGLLRIAQNISSVVSPFIGIIAAVIMLAGMIASGGIIGLIMFAPILPCILSLWQTKRNTVKLAEMQKGFPKINALYGYYYNEYIGQNQAAKDIRIYNQRGAIEDIVRKTGFGKLRKLIMRVQRSRITLVGGLNAAISAAAYILIGLIALRGEISIGLVTEYVGAMQILSSSLASFIGQIGSFAENTPFLLEVFSYLDMRDIKTGGGKHAGDVSEPEIVFHDVSFRYPGASDFALKNLNLTIRPGKKMAVVGLNGSGKTTMIKLLTRLYDPTEGIITLNGIDIREYNYHEYQKLFSVVFQDFALAGFTVGENVAVSDEYDRMKAEKLLTQVGFGTKHSLDTYVGKKFDKQGADLSGGEAQKLAIARALYKSAPLVVLDEPTAALDPIAESEIYEKFDELVGERTAIYISHRLSSCRFCDEIAVFREGEMVQKGAHGELLRDESGLYSELWNAQAQYYR